MKKSPSGQMSDTLIVGMFLALSGGFMDSYTYLCRGQVFANAETGNLIMIGLNLSQGNVSKAIGYVFPVLAFAFGVLTSEHLRKKYSNSFGKIHWRQRLILVECLVFVCVAFIPLGSFDRVANVMISYVSAMQMQSFRKCRGILYTTTMCTGNLRSGTEKLYKYLSTKNISCSVDTLIYYIIIITFVVGATIGGFVVHSLGRWAILVSIIPLLTAYFLMCTTGEKMNS